MSNFKLSQTSIDRMDGVHPDLVRVIQDAINFSIVDFGISSGVRTRKEQEEMFERGRTPTMKSKHLIHTDGFGHAVDIYCLTEDGKVTWSEGYYRKAAQAIFASAIKWGVQIKAGALFQSYFDGPHIELNGSFYSATIVD